jgi:hypothetical protein
MATWIGGPDHAAGRGFGAIGSDPDVTNPEEPNKVLTRQALDSRGATTGRLPAIRVLGLHVDPDEPVIGGREASDLSQFSELSRCREGSYQRPPQVSTSCGFDVAKTVAEARVEGRVGNVREHIREDDRRCEDDGKDASTGLEPGTVPFGSL